ncbi:MAG: ammonia-dependent NAD(+) synthetase [Mycoplasmatales bacterium]
MNTVIFGGTFDPPQLGHKAILDELITMDFDEILIVPTQEVDYEMNKTSLEDRIAMIKLWLLPYHDIVQLSNIEMKKNQPLYICDTIKNIKKTNTNNLFIVLDFDSYNSLKTYKEYDYINKNITFIVPNLSKHVENSNNLINLKNSIVNISSCELRDIIRQEYLLEDIYTYIIRNNLYSGYELQKKIVSQMKTKLVINPKEEIETRISFIKNSLYNSNTKCLVLGISGGQDSTLLGKLAKISIDELNRENNTLEYKFIAIRLPFAVQFDEKDCQMALDFINPCETKNINIKEPTNSVVDAMDINVSDFNKGNIKARMRMIIQYAVAAENNSLVLGTDHSAENITGFFTKFGDGACDLAPLFGLNKRQSKKILEYLNCPEELYKKTPTADLEEDKVGISDETALGVTYDEIDNYLEGKKTSNSARNRIEFLYNRSEHKRKMPATIYDN